MPRPPAAAAIVMAALILSAAACGANSEDAGDGAAAQTTSTSTSTSTSIVDPAERGSGADGSTTNSNSNSTTTSTSTTAADEDDTTEDQPTEDVVIVGSLASGELMIDDRRFDVPIGSTVRIEFTSDEVEHVHLHGYDILADVGPGLVAELVFLADSPGTFEVELEDSGRFLFELLVR